MLLHACQRRVLRTGCLLLATGIIIYKDSFQQLQLSFTDRAFSAALSSVMCYTRSATSPSSCIHTGGQLPTSQRRKEIGIQVFRDTRVQVFRTVLAILRLFKHFKHLSALSQPATAGEVVPKAVELLPSSLEEGCLVTSVVALMDVLWLFWFSSAGAAQGSCSELVCRKALVATDSC